MSGAICEQRSGALTRGFWLVVAMLFAAACSQSNRAPQGPTSFATLSADASARPYRVITDESTLSVRVYREGSLATFGHNHVISSVSLQGVIYLAEPLNKSTLEIRLPLLELEVDKPEQRLAAGEDFPGTLDAEDIAGTRENMLGERQLDATNWPELILRSRAVEAALPALLVHADIAVKAAVHPISIPVRLDITDAGLVASGSFSVRQTELGLEPFSVMLGALRVRDQLDIDFRIVARPAVN